MELKLFAGLRPFKAADAARDMLAGVSLATINIPQVLGYTRIAQTPVVTGLYTVLLPLVAFAIFGSSRQLVVSADSATAAIFSNSLSPLAAPMSEKYMALVALTALLAAGLLLAARLFRLGFLADFLSRTVLVGFLTGVGAQVAIAMLPDMFGIAAPSGGALRQLWRLAPRLAEINGSSLALAGATAAAILIGRRLLPRFPVAMIAVLAAIGASWRFDFAGHGVSSIGPVPGGLPALALPPVSVDDMLAVAPIAVSCVFVIIAQSAATARAFAERHHQRIDANADILGLAAANAAAGLSGAFVVNGSPTQTAMAERAGAHSQFAQLTFAAIVLLVLLFATGPLQYLPRSVLAGVVFAIAVGMIDLQTLRAIRRESPGEFWLAVVTAATVVAIGVEAGILIAITLSLFRHVGHSYRPHTMVLTPDANGWWTPIDALPGEQTEPGLIVYRFGSDLFYANDHIFVDEVKALIDAAPDKVRWLIVDAGAITDIDYSAATTLRDFLGDLTASGVTVMFGRVRSYLQADFDRHGVTAALGQGRLFRTLHEALTAARGVPPPPSNL
ncbi:sulphate transporter [Methylocella silvestris BL2]|uniref:Sulphate transporter n=1 Tax=Methylocella silvestris (strain DSM 15510 / CIP 108128 / LMG 27833 / NCIMB 13906 / BL2) TaxID=395965 RepID=B8EIS4_METSB|nr:SulP family inorganic anion transporter [Methylocella silvestris]ACK51891.1 sulphate transporter [Methylocella silvestris BL2]